MTVHEEKAEKLFLQGCNCSQAVFAAFSDVTGIDETQSIKMSSSFGGGFGRMREVCGAVCAMTLALSCIYGYTDLGDPEEKKRNYALTSSLINKFRQENGSYICKEILGISDYKYSPVATPRTKEFYDKRPCIKCIKSAARLLDETITEQGI